MNEPGALFPSYVFTRRLSSGNSATWGIYLADAGGKCERLVNTIDAGAYGRTLELWVSGNSGVILDTRLSWIQAMGFWVDFDQKGIPVVTASDFEQLLQTADLPHPSVAPAGWQMQGVDIPFVSPDGTKVMMKSYGDSATDGSGNVTWVCAFNSNPGDLSISDCSAIHYGAQPEFVSSAWGSTGQAVYFTHRATSGSGNALYRLTLPQEPEGVPVVEQIWSLGTMFRDVKVTQSGDKELLAVSETRPDFCARIYVVDAGECGANGCTILNGEGHPARWGGWLPNGRLIADGQSSPNKRNGCYATNQIVTFEPDDTTGTVTVLGVGYQPDGAGSG